MMRTVIAPPDLGLFRLRLAGAHQPREDGFIGIDGIKTDAVDHIIDLKIMPWPIEDGVVDTIFTAFYLHRLDMAERVAFMNECCRVLKVGAQLVLVVPNWSSDRAYEDPRAKWPPFAASFLTHLKKATRAPGVEEELGLVCDFEYGYGYGMDPELVPRNEQFQQDAIKYKTNAALDVHVTLTKVSPP